MTRAPTTILLTLVATIAWAGCSSTPKPMGAARTGDFTLGVSVLRDQQRGSTGPDARYIVDASGILHASFGEGSRPDTHPGFTRRLTARELDTLWALARTIELANPIGDTEPEPQWHPGEPVRGAAGREMILVELKWRATRRVIEIDPEDADGDRLVAALDALAWAEELSGALDAPTDDR